MKKYISLFLTILVFEIISVSIGITTQDGVDGWYATLQAPPFTPPNIAFPIMWTILYALIATAGWTLWRARHNTADNKKLLLLFAVYMALNWLWMPIFFTWHLLGVAFAWLVVHNIAAIALIALSWNRARRVSYLLLPALFWTLYAAYLSGGYWVLNK